QKEEDAGGGGGGEGSTLRTDFRPLAHWDPSIKTDASGNARITFKLPESLTTFRLMATAATKASEFGMAATDVVVTKPLVLQQALPRFARLGDTFSAGVLISNQTGTAGQAVVKATPEVIRSVGTRSKEIELEAGETREVLFEWSTSEMGDANIDFAATLGAEEDALRASIPILLPTTRTTTATLAQTDSTANESLALPQDRISSLDRLTATTAGTGLVGLGGAFEYLFEYPYGCLEQRTSRIRPLLIASEVAQAFNLEVLDGDAGDLIRQWLSDLDSFWDGTGFSLWPGGRYHPPYLNAYVLAALAEAREAGYDVSEVLVDDAVRAVESMARRRSAKPAYYSQRSWRVSRAFMLYALAKHERILEDEIATLVRDELEQQDGGSVESVSYLLRTLPLAESALLNSYRERLLERLRSTITIEATTAFASLANDQDYRWIYSSTNRATALAIAALAETAAGDDERLIVQRMIRYLLSKRTENHWASTQENIASIEAFGSYFRAYEQLDPDFDATISVAGSQVLTESVRGRSAVASSRELDLTAHANSTEVPIQLSKVGRGTLYYELVVDTYTTQPLAALSSGLSVVREIQRLDDAGRSVGRPTIVGDETVVLDAGQLVKVTVTLRSQADRNYVVVDDALPAGLEALNAAFDTSNREQTRDSGTSRWWGSFNHSEMRDDRVLLFADYLERGEHTYRYIARATTSGSFVYPPLQSELMYEPSVTGRTATGRLSVRPPNPSE
ncbi:MAG: hypothetical protein HKN13_10155, partial [Rhodothermales bacterium]|nr:hypothetical protein [Rhodothermales bacterium]